MTLSELGTGIGNRDIRLTEGLFTRSFRDILNLPTMRIVAGVYRASQDTAKHFQTPIIGGRPLWIRRYLVTIQAYEMLVVCSPVIPCIRLTSSEFII